MPNSQPPTSLPWRIQPLILYYVAYHDRPDPAQLRPAPDADSEVFPQDPSCSLPLLLTRSNEGESALSRQNLPPNDRHRYPNSPVWTLKSGLIYQLYLPTARLTILPSQQEAYGARPNNPCGELPDFSRDALTQLCQTEPKDQADAPEVAGFQTAAGAEPYAYALLPHCRFQITRVFRCQPDAIPAELPAGYPWDDPDHLPPPELIDHLIQENRSYQDRLAVILNAAQQRSQRGNLAVAGPDVYGSFNTAFPALPYRSPQSLIAEAQQNRDLAQQEIEYWEARRQGPDNPAALAAVIRTYCLPIQTARANAAAYRYTRSNSVRAGHREDENQELQDRNALEQNRLRWWQSELKRFAPQTADNPADRKPPLRRPIGPLEQLLAVAQLYDLDHNEDYYDQAFRKAGIQARFDNYKGQLTTRNQSILLYDVANGAPLGRITYAPVRKGQSRNSAYWGPEQHQSEQGSVQLDRTLDRALERIAAIRQCGAAEPAAAKQPSTQAKPPLPAEPRPRPKPIPRPQQLTISL